jgi:hypothetical protein
LKHLARYSCITVGLAVFLAVAFPTSAHADGIPKDEITTAKKPRSDQNSDHAWLRKMAGSTAEISSYIGSGTFYATGYRDPYISTAIFVRPTYDLGTRFKLSANARLYIEEEFTQSDLQNGRRFNPLDIWLWLSAKELHRFETSQIRLGGTARLVVPFSYESLYSHMLVGVAGGLNLTRAFEFGKNPAPEKRWNLAVSVGSVFTKYIHSSDLRGNGPGDTSGCRPFLAAGAASGSVGSGPSASESDRCGGPVNTNVSLTSSLLANLARGLDSRYQNLRFPFFDLSGGANANNFTQAFVGLNGTL